MAVIDFKTTIPGLTPNVAAQNNVTLAGIVAVTGGGTGATTPQTATTALLPAQAGNAGKFLATNGNTVLWLSPSSGIGNGTVTSVAASGGGTGLTLSGGPITSSGTLTLGGTLNIANGGTGAVTANNALNNLLPNQAGFNGAVLTSDGTNTHWLNITSSGTVNSVQVDGGTTGMSFFGGPITNAGTMTMTGILSIQNGGTQANTRAGGLNNLLPPQSSQAGKFLMSNGIDAVWAAGGGGGGGGVTSVNASALGTGLTFTGGPIDVMNPSGTLVLGGVLNAASGGLGFDASSMTANQAVVSDGAGNLIPGTILNTDTYVSVDTTIPGTIDIGLAKNHVTLGTTVAYLGDVEPVLAGLTTVTVTQDPVAALDLATKQYVDAKAATIATKAPVKAASTANVATLSGPVSLDSISCVAGDRVLIKNQTTSTNDGIYVVAAGAWSRSADCDTAAELVGASVFVVQGSTQASTTWVQTDLNPLATQQTWIQSAGAGTYTAGTGLNLTGNAFSIANTTVTPGLYGTPLKVPQIQINAQGQITSAVEVTIASVTTINGGATGLTPLAATGGNVTLGGIVNPLSGGTGLDNSNALTNSILIANGPTSPGAGDASFSAEVLTAGAGISITRAPGVVTITNTGGGGGGGVTTFSGGPTGLTPAVATTGAVTLGGKLGIAYGGTNATSATQAFLNLAPGITGNANKFLTTDGVGTISWGALPTGLVSAYAITVTTNGLLANKLATAGITDAIGNIYELFNSTGTAVTLSTTTVTNTAAFSSVSTANTIIVPASGSVTILTTTAGSVYSVVASNLGTGAVSPATLGDIPTLLANGSLVDSGKYFDDTDTTNNNYWSASQTANYVVNQLLNVPSLPQVQVATTANVGLTGLTAIDGYTPIAGDFVLVKNQTIQGQNGIYKAAAGAWTRQVYNTTTKLYQNIAAETLYSELNINGGVTNVINGTVNKNLQFQFYIPDPTATIATNGSSVLVTAVTKLPVASPNNRYVDVNIGNDTNNNGSSAFPFATITKAQVGMSYPSTITLSSSGGSYTGNVTFSSSQSNCTIQGQNFAHDGGQTQLTGQVTFGSNNTRVDFVNTVHNTGALAPFVFSGTALCRSYFQGLIITTSAADWLGLQTTTPNWITLDNLDFGNPLATAVNLPAFSAGFQLNITNQSRQVLRMTGTGAANTIINITNCNDGMVWVPPTYVGNIIWQGSPFSGQLGSAAWPVGVVSNQTDMDTITGWTTDGTYDGWYAIDNFAPTSFEQGAIFGKYTVGGVTFLYWGRDQNQAPATISTRTDTTYQKTATGWSLIGGTSALAQDIAGGLAGQVLWQQGVNDTAFTAVGTAGQHLISAGAASPVWATVPQSNYIATSTGGSVNARILGAGLVDVNGASYVIYNSGGSAITLTATGFGNYQSFTSAATATSLTINPFQSAVLTTTTATTNYAIESITGLQGASTVYAVTMNSDTSVATVLTTASIVDVAQAVYVVTNLDTVSHTLSLGTTVMNPNAFPGYISNPNITVPAGGTATITTASPLVSYYVMNISNSVADGLSGGLVNEIPYQVGPNDTGFIANLAGDAGKFLVSNGVSSAPAWATPPGTHYLAAGATGALSTLISTASITDAVGYSYAIVNTSGANINVTAGNFVNFASFNTVATATQITLKPNQTALVSTRTPGTNYVIDAVSGLGGGGTTALSISTGDTLANLLTAASVTDQVGNTYVVTNTATTSTPLTVGTTINNASSFPNSIATNVITLLPKQVVTLTTTAVGANYTVENLSGVQTVFSLSTALATDTLANILTTASIIDYVGNVYTINNTGTVDSVITFAAVTGYTAFPAQATNTTVTIPAGGSITVSTKTYNADYQLITIANALTKTYYINFNTAGATWTVPQVLTGANITDVVGNTYVIYNGLVSNFALTATAYKNPNSYAIVAASATSLRVNATATVTLTCTKVGSDYIIADYSSVPMTQAFSINVNSNVGGLNAYKELVGMTYVIQNTAATAVTLTNALGTYTNYESFGTSATSTVITLQPKQTVVVSPETLLTNYRIISMSSAVGSYPVTTAVGGTVAAILAAQVPAINDVVGNRYIISNTGSSTITLTATAFTNYTAFPAQATSAAIALYPGANCEIQTTSVSGAAYSIVTMSQTGGTNSVVFRASGNSSCVIPGAPGVIALNVLDFDPTNAWNSAQSRWIPQTAGYYQVDASVCTASSSVDMVTSILKNGITIATTNSGQRTGYSGATTSVVVYMNGTTDYLQLVGRGNGSNSAGPEYTFLSASLQTAQPAVVASNAIARGSMAADQTINNNATTKLLLNSAVYNPRGWWDTANSKFQPNVAGYYQVSSLVSSTTTWATGGLGLIIRKTGVNTSIASIQTANQGYMNGAISDTVYLNGAGDYLELYIYQATGASKVINSASEYTYFDVALVSGPAVPTGAVMQGTSNVFKVIPGAAIAIAASNTLMNFNNVIYDPTSAYTPSTGKFQPTTPGYYRMVGRVFTGGVATNVQAAIWLNGVAVATNSAAAVGSGWAANSEVSTIVYLNGTTDYVQLYGYALAGGGNSAGINSEFSGELIGGVTSTPLATGPQLFKSFYGVAGSTYVNIPGDNIAVAWAPRGGGFSPYIKTLSGTASVNGVSSFTGPTGNGGAPLGLTGTPWSITTTPTLLGSGGWVFFNHGDRIFAQFTDSVTGYTYTINTVLGSGGNNNYFTIQRN